MAGWFEQMGEFVCDMARAEDHEALRAAVILEVDLHHAAAALVCIGSKDIALHAAGAGGHVLSGSIDGEKFELSASDGADQCARRFRRGMPDHLGTHIPGSAAFGAYHGDENERTAFFPHAGGCPEDVEVVGHGLIVRWTGCEGQNDRWR